MKDIPGFEGRYAITEDGKVFSFRSQKFLNQKSKNGWYVQVTFIKDGKRMPFRIHRLVAEAFIKRGETQTEVNHKNGIKTDNRVENLEWCNRSQNIKHAFDVLLRKKPEGETHPKSKLLLDLQTGVYYESIQFAARAKGLTRNQIKSALRKKPIYCNLMYA